MAQGRAPAARRRRRHELRAQGRCLLHLLRRRSEAAEVLLRKGAELALRPPPALEGAVSEAWAAPAARTSSIVKPEVVHTLLWLGRKPSIDTTYSMVGVQSPLAVGEHSAPLLWAPLLMISDKCEEPRANAGGEGEDENVPTSEEDTTGCQDERDSPRCLGLEGARRDDAGEGEQGGDHLQRAGRRGRGQRDAEAEGVGEAGQVATIVEHLGGVSLEDDVIAFMLERIEDQMESEKQLLSALAFFREAIDTSVEEGFITRTDGFLRSCDGTVRDSSPGG